VQITTAASLRPVHDLISGFTDGDSTIVEARKPSIGKMEAAHPEDIGAEGNGPSHSEGGTMTEVRACSLDVVCVPGLRSASDRMLPASSAGLFRPELACPQRVCRMLVGVGALVWAGESLRP